MSSISSFGQRIQSFFQKSPSTPGSEAVTKPVKSVRAARHRSTDAVAVQSLAKGKSSQNLHFLSTSSDQLKAIDSPAVFRDSNAATAEEIDAVLSHYGSPHAGKGDILLGLCQKKGINPILMLAIMQQESSYGNKSNNKSLSDENVANPWSVHFNEPADGINKLRLKDGSMPSFKQSLGKAIDIMKRLAGDSSNPLTQAGKRYSTTSSWTNAIKAHYQTQLNRIDKMR